MGELVRHHWKDQPTLAVQSFTNRAHQFTIRPCAHACFDIGSNIGGIEHAKAGTHVREVELATARLWLVRPVTSLRAVTAPTQVGGIVQKLAPRDGLGIFGRRHLTNGSLQRTVREELHITDQPNNQDDQDAN